MNDLEQALAEAELADMTPKVIATQSHAETTEATARFVAAGLAGPWLVKLVEAVASGEQVNGSDKCCENPERVREAIGVCAPLAGRGVLEGLEPVLVELLRARPNKAMREIGQIVVAAMGTPPVEDRSVNGYHPEVNV